MANKIEILPEAKATAELKNLFRGRKVWKDFCEKFIEEKGCKCEICYKSLTKVIGNVHHRCRAMTMAEYMNLEPSRFMLLCTSCHDWVHLVHNSPRFKDKKWFVRNEEL